MTTVTSVTFQAGTSWKSGEGFVFRFSWTLEFAEPPYPDGLRFPYTAPTTYSGYRERIGDRNNQAQALTHVGSELLRCNRANEAIEASARIPIDLPLNVLKKYPARSIDGLVLLQAEQARKQFGD